jgi:hypothetical protein
MAKKKQVKNLNVKKEDSTRKYNWFFILAIILAIISIISSFFIIIPVIGLVVSLLLLPIYLIWFVISIIMLIVFLKNNSHWTYLVLPIYYIITSIFSVIIGFSLGLSGNDYLSLSPSMVYLTILFSTLEIIYASYMLLRKN